MGLGPPHWLPQIFCLLTPEIMFSDKGTSLSVNGGGEEGVEDLRIGTQLRLKFQQKEEPEPRTQISESASHPRLAV